MKAHNRHVLAALMSVAFTLSVSQAMAKVIVSDSFESGDMSAPGYEGFSWGHNNRTSLVSSTEVLWNNGPKSVDKPEGRDWAPYHGENSLRFRYSAGSNMAEQRFSMSEGQPEIWVSFWLKVPTNFYHPTGNDNQKLFAIWMDDYEFSGDGPTVVWQFRRSEDPAAGEGGSISRLYHVADSESASGTGRHSGEESASEILISTDSNRGMWTELVFRVVASSEPGQDDGIIQSWRRWEGEDNYTLLHSQKNARLAIPQGSEGFKAGYVMGWANAPYLEDTEFLIDSFRISTESLFGLKPKPPTPM